MSCHFFSTLSKTEVLQSAGWIFNLRKPLGKDKLPFSSNPVSQSPASTFPSVLPPRQSFTGVHEGPTVGSGFCSLERASALLVHQRKPLQSSWNGQWEEWYQTRSGCKTRCVLLKIGQLHCHFAKVLCFQGNFPLRKTEICFVLTIKNTLSSAHIALCNIPLPITAALTDKPEFTGDSGPSALNTFTPKSSAKHLYWHLHKIIFLGNDNFCCLRTETFSLYTQYNTSSFFNSWSLHLSKNQKTHHLIRLFHLPSRHMGCSSTPTLEIRAAHWLYTDTSC